MIILTSSKRKHQCVNCIASQVGVYRRSVVDALPMDPGPVTKAVIYHQQPGVGLGDILKGVLQRVVTSSKK